MNVKRYTYFTMYYTYIIFKGQERVESSMLHQSSFMLIQFLGIHFTIL